MAIYFLYSLCISTIYTINHVFLDLMFAETYIIELYSFFFLNEN